ncbi:MAG: hypothetical protein H6860_05630 [Rhodospirillales bacterium]|nr:hypothetical protein [Rhodospirillales bacterium]
MDNDPESIRVTRRHMEANGVPDGKGNVRTLVNEGFSGALCRIKARMI